MKKYIITDKENVVHYISDQIQELEDRYLLTNEKIEVFKDYPIKDITGRIIHNEMAMYNIEIPESVTTFKYCYSKQDGFYLNPNYVEPPKPIDERVSLLETNSTEYELALAEIYEELINRG